MSFNGVTKPYITVLEKIRPSWAPIKRNILTIKGLPGGYLEDTDTQPRPIGVKILIESKEYFSDLNKLKEDIAAWLITSEAKALIFEDESDRIYFAAVDGSLDLDEIVCTGQGIIYFICPDPYKYGLEDSTTGISSVVVNNKGFVETEPVIICKIKQDTTFVAVSNGDKLNMIGMPAKVEQIPVAPETDIYINTSLTGWTVPAPTEHDPGEITGVLKYADSAIYSDDYGVGPGWHGPSSKTSFGTTVKDFRLDIGLRMIPTGGNQAGGIVVTLLNAQSLIVTRVNVIKHFGHLNSYYSKVSVGYGGSAHDIIPESGPAVFNYPYFQGIFRVLRVGNLWTAAIYQLIDGVIQSPYIMHWTDSNNIAIADVAQIQVQLIQRADFPVVDQKIDEIQLYRQNNVNANQVPHVARAGDIVEFNHKEDIILKNGVPITKEKAFIGEYFQLTQGPNTIIAEPKDAIESTEVRWRPKWR
jgi:predicted phage tail component-like protein